MVRATRVVRVGAGLVRRGSGSQVVLEGGPVGLSDGSQSLGTSDAVWPAVPGFGPPSCVYRITL